MGFGRATPVLRIFDEKSALSFYVEYLGFHVDWSHRLSIDAPLYMQLSKGECLLHLSEHHGDACPGASLRIECQEVDDLEEELTTKSYAHCQPQMHNMPWGTREMSIADPFGNWLTFYRVVPPFEAFWQSKTVNKEAEAVPA